MNEPRNYFAIRRAIEMAPRILELSGSPETFEDAYNVEIEREVIDTIVEPATLALNRCDWDDLHRIGEDALDEVCGRWRNIIQQLLDEW